MKNCLKFCDRKKQLIKKGFPFKETLITYIQDTILYYFKIYRLVGNLFHIGKSIIIAKEV